MMASISRVIRHKGLTGLARAVATQAQITACRGFLGMKHLKRRIHTYDMYLALDDRGISRTLLLFGSREEEHRQLLMSVLKPGMTVFDIGANIGYYVLMERSRIGDSGRIVAIEPSPRNVTLLQRNLDLNGYSNITVRHAGVSDSRGIRQLMLSTMTNLNTFHADGSAGRSLSGEVVDVPTLTVPDLAVEYGPPDLLRMDVEGHEVEILNGLLPQVEVGTLAPMILFETHRGTYTPAHDIATPLRRLFVAGYRVPFLASSSAAAADGIAALGYRHDGLFATDFEHRAIFRDVTPDHLLELLAGRGGVRTILLARP